MPGIKEIISVTVENELHTCPACGYERGFHTSFLGPGKNRDIVPAAPREVFFVILICPECGARYNVGWQVMLHASDSRSGSALVRASTCVPHGNPAACLPAPPHHDEHPPE